jgi:paired amphipathic helix protein Sin3a
MCFWYPVEFTYFLPDAVQDVAKSRLAVAAANSERRLQKQRRDAKRARESSKGVIDSSNGFQQRKRARLETNNSDRAVIGALERRFFDRVKGFLRSNTMYNEFLAVLNMYNNSIITSREMMSLTADLLGPTSVLQVELKKVKPIFFVLNLFLILLVYICSCYGMLLSKLISSVDNDNEEDEIWFGIPLTSIDFSSCKRCTPSYRALPEMVSRNI